MKINEFKTPDDEQYSEEDINAVINQAVNGPWLGRIPIDEFIESLSPGFFQRLKDNENQHDNN